jgi:hypothetical protein
MKSTVASRSWPHRTIRGDVEVCTASSGTVASLIEASKRACRRSGSTAVRPQSPFGALTTMATDGGGPVPSRVAHTNQRPISPACSNMDATKIHLEVAEISTTEVTESPDR